MSTVWTNWRWGALAVQQRQETSTQVLVDPALQKKQTKHSWSSGHVSIPRPNIDLIYFSLLLGYLARFCCCSLRVITWSIGKRYCSTRFPLVCLVGRLGLGSTGNTFKLALSQSNNEKRWQPLLKRWPCARRLVKYWFRTFAPPKRRYRRRSSSCPSWCVGFGWVCAGGWCFGWFGMVMWWLQLLPDDVLIQVVVCFS